MERKSVKESESNEKKSQKSVKKIIGGAVTALLSVIFAIVFITFIVVMIQIGQGKTPSLFNHRFYVIVTDSMTPNINVDDVILSKVVTKDDTDLFVEGAVITYTAESGPMKGREVTHRIVKGVHFNEEINDFAVITKGDKAGAKEDYPVRLSRINAVMERKTVLVSWLVGVFKHGAGFALLFALPLGIMLICLIVKLIMTIKNPALAEEKKKQTDEERIEEIKKQAVEEYLQNNSKDDEGKE
ncbi:MAG: S26 family signal peptidase [Clostridia bacterium]|nr:S26 family signal peptidase [Clostridia bacterium]